ncbi:MAG: hypothetical protein V7711_04700 [Pseudomonadales bacterium]
MLYVKRDETGAIIAVSRDAAADMDEQVAVADPQLAEFLNSIDVERSALNKTDMDFIRVLEDVVELLISKRVILFTDLPESAQEKMLLRQELRHTLHDKLDLLNDGSIEF